MKFIIGFVCFATSCVCLFSQEKIGDALFRASYDFSYKTNTSSQSYPKKDLMYLDIGKNISIFYSRYNQIRDSIKNVGLMKGDSPEEINMARRGYKRGTSPIYYQFDNQQKRKVTTTYVSLGFLYEEQLTMPKWTILNDTIDIMGYSCQKAITNYLGRTWEVYFTYDIPLNKGPWKLWGLPGLILKAKDTDNYFLFELKEFNRLASSPPIIYINHRFNGKEYEKISKIKYLQFEKSYHEDSISFIQFILGTSFKTSDGKPLLSKKKADYIPLEK